MIFLAFYIHPFPCVLRIFVYLVCFDYEAMSARESIELQEFRSQLPNVQCREWIDKESYYSIKGQTDNFTIFISFHCGYNVIYRFIIFIATIDSSNLENGTDLSLVAVADFIFNTINIVSIIAMIFYTLKKFDIEITREVMDFFTRYFDGQKLKKNNV